MADKVDLYPFTVFNFKVSIGVDDSPLASFAEASGLTKEFDPIEYRSGNAAERAVQKIPGLYKVPNIVLKRGYSKNTELFEWFQEVIDGKADYRRDGYVALLGEDKKEVLQWDFFNAWPIKLEGPSLNGKNNEVAIESLELAYERLTFKTL